MKTQGFKLPYSPTMTPPLVSPLCGRVISTAARCLKVGSTQVTKQFRRTFQKHQVTDQVDKRLPSRWWTPLDTRIQPCRHPHTTTTTARSPTRTGPLHTAHCRPLSTAPCCCHRCQHCSWYTHQLLPGCTVPLDTACLWRWWTRHHRRYRRERCSCRSKQGWTALGRSQRCRMDTACTLRRHHRHCTVPLDTGDSPW